VPDEEKYEVFLRAQKNVGETKPHKGRTPDCGFSNPVAAQRAAER